MKSIVFENPFNHEHLICDNVKEIQIIDGVEYLTVYKKDQSKKFLFRKDILKKVDSFHKK